MLHEHTIQSGSLADWLAGFTIIGGNTVRVVNSISSTS